MLDFRDRFNKEQKLKITKAERDLLLSQGLIQSKLLRRHEYNLTGGCVELYRNDAGVLCSREYVREPLNVARVPKTAGDRLRAMGLTWEARTMAVRLNCETMLHHAPANSGTYQMQTDGAVLFGG